MSVTGTTCFASCLKYICPPAGYQSDTASSNISGKGQESPKKGSLKEYVDKFSPETVQEMARIVSQEAAQLIDMQASALFGDYRQLQEQMQVLLLSTTAKPLTFSLNCAHCCANSTRGYHAVMRLAQSVLDM